MVNGFAETDSNKLPIARQRWIVRGGTAKATEEGNNGTRELSTPQHRFHDVVVKMMIKIMTLIIN